MARDHRASLAPNTPKRRVSPLLLCFLLLSLPAWSAAAGTLLERPELRAFIAEMTSRHGFDGAELEALFAKVDTHQKIIDAITRPAEAKPWHAYRRIFMTEARIEGGARFWEENAALLDAAAARFGVPPQVIVAIIGVETNYGRNAGYYQVIDALTTLALDYPRRADFFRSELEHFLLLSREEGFDPLVPEGSYAGAMGLGQFIPSSYRSYAIDFDDDGRRDLFGNRADAIGSVANYFAEHGWRQGGRVALPVEVDGEAYRPLVAQGYKPHTPVDALPGYGVRVPGDLDGAQLAALLELDAENGPEHWLVLHNFYVITRYNHSPLYAMAVYQLSEAIAARRDAEPEPDGRG